MAQQKIRVILNGPINWLPWISKIRTMAINMGVWDHLDLSKSNMEIKLLMMELFLLEKSDED